MLARASFHSAWTTIASWENGEKPKLLDEVIQLDNNSVITRTCRDFLIKVTIDDDQGVREYWLNFTTTEITTEPVLPTPGSQVNNTEFSQANTAEPVPLTTGSLTAISVGITVGAIVFSVIIGVSLYLCLSKRKKQSFLWLCNALKKRFSTEAESSEPGETRHLSEGQDTSATGNQPNGISLEEVVATYPSGCGENGGAKDNPHGSVHDISVRPRCDAANIMAKEEFQPTANGHLNNPDVNGASHHGDMNSVRNLRDDPGGSDGDVREDSDTEAEAEPLVNKGGQNQDHVGRCSATPEPDVESKTGVKNFGDY
ncbi:uncharacterized protein LOC133023741 [Limanda limanda]|uniref:uncharacterized protein LOC133023741 n=1 Tax=Limanda limanda TaxID=27771 RepID=UPI0029C96632|nr:uncharacterized protein LOC133023741 [Limanda limanda]